MALRILKISKEGIIIRGKKLPGGKFKDIEKLLKVLIEKGFIVSRTTQDTPEGPVETYNWSNLTEDEIIWLDEKHPEWRQFFPSGPSPIVHTPDCRYKVV